MSRRAEKHKATAPCICRKATCTECAHHGTRTCRMCLRKFVFRLGQSQSTSRCSPDCGTHNETLDLLAARLREVERRFVEYMEKNTHIGTVW